MRSAPAKSRKPAPRKPQAARARSAAAAPAKVRRSWLPWANRPKSRASAPRPISTGLSLDRKIDIVGIVFSLGGLLTLLMLLSGTNGSLTGSWLGLLGRAFGWGGYVFPVALISVGLWLVLRNFERVPQLSVERMLGALLLFVNLVAWLHLLALPEDRTVSYGLAAAGRGGGYLGYGVFELLHTYLGLGGTAVALAAWLLVGLALTLDRSVAELFGWIVPLVIRLQDGWDDLMVRRAEAAHRPVSIPPPPRLSGPAAVLAEAAAQSGASQPAVANRGFIPAGGGQGQAWALPALTEILESGVDLTHDDDLDRRRARVVEETLASFGAPVNVVEINRGPTITQFGVEPDFIETRNGRTRVRVGKIAGLADDLALALSARRIRVEAPVPGKGFVGIEVPNEQIATVALRDVIESEAFKRSKSPLRFAIGQDVAGNAVAADLTAMPHLLIAGSTGSGKSVCVNTLICCLLINNTPEDLRLIMVDPKRVELTGYNGIPHLLAPVVVEMERVAGALQWVLREMDSRYQKLAQIGCRSIADYNLKCTARGEKKLPYLVVIVDELADLMMLAPEETERSLTRLAQLARATGIHLVIATQRPSVDVITGLIKANFPARIAFAVTSGIDSRVILDQPGAERLLGRGDMLFQAPDAAAPLRLQGAYVSDVEINRLVEHWGGQGNQGPLMLNQAAGPIDTVPAGLPLKQMPLWEDEAENVDPMLKEAIDLVRRQGRASISLLQRRLRIGYTRSARMIETMQAKGIVGTEAGPQGFEVLDYGDAAPPIEEQGD